MFEDEIAIIYLKSSDRLIMMRLKVSALHFSTNNFIINNNNNMGMGAGTMFQLGGGEVAQKRFSICFLPCRRTGPCVPAQPAAP